MAEAKKKAPKTCPLTNELTPFGEAFDSLPDNMDGLDAVIDHLQDELQSTVENMRVVEKYDQVGVPDRPCYVRGRLFIPDREGGKVRGGSLSSMGVADAVFLDS